MQAPRLEKTSAVEARGSPEYVKSCEYVHVGIATTSRADSWEIRKVVAHMWQAQEACQSFVQESEYVCL